MEDNKRNDEREQSGKKNPEQEQPKHHHHFQVKHMPKGLFRLFNKDETYIYEKKFSCELPKNIIPPKSFHYPFSLENFCQADLLTMDFDLKKNPEILTDPKINTFIYQDFINNSLELIFPHLTTIFKKRTDEEQNFKKKIIEITENNEDNNQTANEDLREIPDFLRRQTYLRPSTVINEEKKVKAKEKLKPEKKQKTSLQELIKNIEQSFNDADKIKVGMKHPSQKKKGVTAKNVYDLSPLNSMPNIKFIEYLFPSEPSEIPNLDEKYLAPNHFIITNNQANDIIQENTCSLYINNKLKTQENNNKKDSSEYYTYEREFISSKMTANDLFNRYFLILDKNEKKLKISPLVSKISFRRYKKMTEANLNKKTEEEKMEGDGEGEEGGEANPNKDLLNKKRKRDIITIPENMSKEEIEEKKKWFKDRGYTTGFTERRINEVDHSDVMEIEKERQKEEELKNLNSKSDEEDIFNEDENEDNASNENKEKDNEGEEEDMFAEFDDDDNDEGKDKNESENEEEQDSKNDGDGGKKSEEENEEGEGDKADEEENDEMFE